ncbi:MAG TPA: DUF480 domain-containing protein [Phycisphaerae bacterium]|nr:DUF480 domain-containing protein [Phycisphaerae bacterium]HRW52086.1 DUF480 domain-containing protein [Phycisphaerae bacterium]
MSDTMTMRDAELRVLGVLIEKSLAQPAYYPMTVNAITAAANQKNNRDPVTDYSEGEVSDALASLRRRQWVTQAEPERNSRSVKFRHCVEEQTGWNAAQRALMAELLVRGPQTLGELRGRASRMTHLDSADYTRDLLAELETCNPPYVAEMEREAGKSARRFRQLLGGEAPPMAPEPTPSAPRRAFDDVPHDAAGSDDASESLSSRMDRLEREVEALRAEFAELRASRSATSDGPG